MTETIYISDKLTKLKTYFVISFMITYNTCSTFLLYKAMSTIMIYKYKFVTNFAEIGIKL